MALEGDDLNGAVAKEQGIDAPGLDDSPGSAGVSARGAGAAAQSARLRVPQTANMFVGNSAFGTEGRTLQEMLAVLQAHPSGQRARLLVVAVPQLLQSMRERGLQLSHVFPCSECDGYFYVVHD